ncbi:MAG: hypothetical protein J6X60_13305, partial [Ruminiclostridium sp.]|nr:hypothetical protein [Ruminiclostridium sp.]
QIMTDKFEFIGFDACLMGTVETANILATYADYMYGSQETEPGSGWDHTAIADFLAENPKADGLQLGKVVADSFYEACRAAGEEDTATLTVVDLSGIDELVTSFNDFANDIYVSSEDSTAMSNIVRGILSADNFGGNNDQEGYTNMVDLGGIISGCKNYSSSASAAASALSSCVVYNRNGSAHSGATGLSVYYPLSVRGSQELSVFSDVSISPYYTTLVDKLRYASINDGDLAGYDDGDWFDYEGNWEHSYEYDYNEGSDEYYYEQDNDIWEYWSYAESYEPTGGDSPYISFASQPGVNSDGIYNFTLDSRGLDYTSVVSGYVLQKLDGHYLVIGETYDVNADWDNGYFEDLFDGAWLSLPDGQNLSLYPVGGSDGYALYTSPVELNGERTYLRIIQSPYGVVVDGTTDGIDESGAAPRGTVKLKDGDVIVPLYDCTDIDESYYGDEYIVSGDISIDYDYIDEGEYYYSFCIYDLFGDYLMTDYVSFSVDENGDIWFRP